MLLIEKAHRLLPKKPAVLVHKVFTFPGGELGVKLDVDDHLYRFLGWDHTIWARLQSSTDIMELVMVVDALRRWDPRPIKLVMPYVPYGRQDRVCVPGEAFSLKAFATIINGLAFESVVTFDPHSDVTPAVFDRCVTISQITILGHFDALNARIVNGAGSVVFVSPDAGANKKTAELAGHYGHPYFLRADKLRDLATGKIKEITVVNPQSDVEGRDCLIIDDLCDAGGTFIGLADALRAKGARSVELYVTHGLFTKSLLPLRHFDAIWSTNSYHTIDRLKEMAGELANVRTEFLNLDKGFAL